MHSRVRVPERISGSKLKLVEDDRFRFETVEIRQTGGPKSLIRKCYGTTRGGEPGEGRNSQSPTFDSKGRNQCVVFYPARSFGVERMFPGSFLRMPDEGPHDALDHEFFGRK